MPPDAVPAADVPRLWQDVKGAIREGNYAACLAAADAILRVDPANPRAALHQTLCQQRVEAPPAFQPLPRERQADLETRLREEERAQRRHAAEQKRRERQLRTEQARWDAELEALARQAEQDAKQQRARAQAEAVREAATRQPAVVPAGPAPTEPVPAAPPTVAAEAPAGVARPGGEPSVELGPVVVSGMPAEPPPSEVVSPSLAGRPRLPAGAVRINGRQMTSLPDRKLAVAEGDVEVVFENTLITCDRMTLFTDTHDVYAEGRVRLEEGAQVFRGEMVHYNLDTKKGRFLQGTVSAPPWHEHGRSVEHIAEGVYQVTPGYITSCEFEPPHFKFAGQRAIVFSGEKLARVRSAAVIVDQLPFLYLPFLTVADRQTPFFLIPGKRKPWGSYALGGYRYKVPGTDAHQGTVKLDWREHFGWGTGLDHQFDNQRMGKGLLKLYYNPDPNDTEPPSALPNGAEADRYRILWRHTWRPLTDTTVITDLQEYSDVNFRKEFLFREEFVDEDVAESFVSSVTNTEQYALTAVGRKRLNRFQSVTEELPRVTMDIRKTPIGQTRFFSETKFDAANLNSKTANSGEDTEAIRADWFEQVSYALGLLRPLEVTPRAGVRQTYYSKDKQTHGREADDAILSGQFSGGVDTSLKLFRVFPLTTNVLGLNINQLRHVLTPSVGYSYVHEPTVSNDLLNFALAASPLNQLSFGLENKLQTKRPGPTGRPQTVELARLLASVPYTFAGSGNKGGGELGSWEFDLELYPWSWLRVESDWTAPAHVDKRTTDSRFADWNVDLVMVGGKDQPLAQSAPHITSPAPVGFQPGPRGGLSFIPQGQWYAGLGHRYSRNDKTESVLQWDWRLTEKWQVGAFNRYTWKEVVGGAKRFENLREYQYNLRRDLHDWVAEFVYRVDREYGEEVFLTLTLKAYPELPIEMETSYHQPKQGSQSSPFSPVR